MSLTDNLVAYWKLEEASGTRNDSHGTNHLTDNNTVTQAVGKLGNAASFVRTNSEFLSISDNAAMSVGNIDFTFAGWFYFTDGTAAATPLGKDTDSPANSRDYTLGLAHVTNYRFSFYCNGGALIVTSGADLSNNTWYFVVCWHDSVADTVNIQINNGAVASAATGGVAPVDSGAEFQIGARQYSTSRTFWNGYIDSVGFWKRVLTADERTSLYNSGNGLEYPFSTSSYIPRIMRHHFIPALGVR